MQLNKNNSGRTERKGACCKDKDRFRHYLDFLFPENVPLVGLFFAYWILIVLSYWGCARFILGKIYGSVNEVALLSMIVIRSFIIVFALVGTRFLFNDLNRSIDKISGILDEPIGCVKINNDCEEITNQGEQAKKCWIYSFKESLANWRFYLASAIVIIVLYCIAAYVTINALNREIFNHLADRYTVILGLKKPNNNQTNKILIEIQNLVLFDIFAIVSLVILTCINPFVLLLIEYRWLCPNKDPNYTPNENKKGIKANCSTEYKWYLGLPEDKILTKKVWKRIPFVRKILKLIHGNRCLSMPIYIQRNPYHPDKLCGLSPIISSIYKSQIVIAIIVGLISTEIVAAFGLGALFGAEATGVRFIGILTMLLLLGILVAASFGFFTYSFHLLLTDIKEGELVRLGNIYRRVAKRYSGVLGKSVGQSQRPEELEWLGEEIDRIRVLIDDVRRIPKWPISFKISAISSATPPIVFSVLSFVETSIKVSILELLVLAFL